MFYTKVFLVIEVVYNKEQMWLTMKMMNDVRAELLIIILDDLQVSF